MNKAFLNVAIQAPVKTLFDYKINHTSKIKPKIGQRILVPFGKKKRLGFIQVAFGLISTGTFGLELEDTRIIGTTRTAE